MATYERKTKMIIVAAATPYTKQFLVFLKIPILEVDGLNLSIVEGWNPVGNSVICIDHFEREYLKRGKRVTLNYSKNPIQTIITNTEILSKPSLIPSFIPLRKPPTIRQFIHPSLDETEYFKKQDVIHSLEDLNESFCPAVYSFRKMNNHVWYIHVFFEEGDFAANVGSIAIDLDLHVKLYYKRFPIPLPEWFRKGSICKLKSVSMLANLASYMRNRAEETPKTILMELNKLSFYKPQGRIYSNELIRYALMQRYTSRQAYNLLLDEFHLPSISHLKMLSKGGIEPIKALKLMIETGKVDCADCVILVEEMYLQKGVQYHGGSFIGAADDGNLYSGIVLFTVVSLKDRFLLLLKLAQSLRLPVNGFVVKWRKH